ncbi:POLE2 [Acanthosepion pharaonis]|uniref:POLE2 n=1 Tax=Acanthosepion pharaonis TaxID=158019 RepID=A0A812EIZ7_ACAPH|nr:POLE2 [Sepia pharaonis]
MASAKVKIKSQLSSSFKMHGLTLRSDASKYLIEFLETIQPNQRIQCIDKLLDIIQKQPLSSSLIDRALCANIVQECNAGTENDGENAFCVIDAFSVPRYTYSEERKKFILNSNMALPAPLLHGNPFDKCKLFKDRYYMLLQRTMRHNLFTPPAIGNIKDGEKKFQLKPIEHLLGTSTKMGENIVLGMLTQLKEGKWYLEDPSGSVQIDLSQASFHTGLFTENCFVLAEGWHDDGIFHLFLSIPLFSFGPFPLFLSLTFIPSNFFCISFFLPSYLSPFSLSLLTSFFYFPLYLSFSLSFPLFFLSLSP